MQKWRKVLLAVFLIVSIIGGFIGFVMGKFRLGKVKVWANIDILSLLILICLIIMGICLLVDIYGIYKSKKKFGNAKFKVMINTRKRLRNVLIFLALDAIFVFAIFIYSFYIQVLFACFMILILTLTQWIHYITENGIGENGVLHWGVYHSWDEVKSYKIESETLLEMNVLSK